MREERIGGQRLILGDCLEVMPTLGRVDAVVTDPPYGIGDEQPRRSDGRKASTAESATTPERMGCAAEYTSTP